MNYQKIKELVAKLETFEFQGYKDCRDDRKVLQEIKIEAQNLRKAIVTIAKNKTFVAKKKEVAIEETKPFIEEEIEEPVLEKDEEAEEDFLAKQ